ncbi:hypothetical protein NP570_24850, partial [Vibrio parahaemolyticus]|nr:hypothetical protein [Vibrio parahaemolyticus]
WVCCGGLWGFFCGFWGLGLCLGVFVCVVLFFCGGGLLFLYEKMLRGSKQWARREVKAGEGGVWMGDRRLVLEGEGSD